MSWSGETNSWPSSALSWPTLRRVALGRARGRRVGHRQDRAGASRHQRPHPRFRQASRLAFQRLVILATLRARLTHVRCVLRRATGRCQETTATPGGEEPGPREGPDHRAGSSRDELSAGDDRGRRDQAVDQPVDGMVSVVDPEVDRHLPGPDLFQDGL